jgi:hypothetical protein
LSRRIHFAAQWWLAGIKWDGKNTVSLIAQHDCESLVTESQLLSSRFRSSRQQYIVSPGTCFFHQHFLSLLLAIIKNAVETSMEGEESTQQSLDWLDEEVFVHFYFIQQARLRN